MGLTGLDVKVPIAKESHTCPGCLALEVEVARGVGFLRLLPFVVALEPGSVV